MAMDGHLVPEGESDQLKHLEKPPHPTKSAKKDLSPNITVPKSKRGNKSIFKVSDKTVRHRLKQKEIVDDRIWLLFQKFYKAKYNKKLSCNEDPFPVGSEPFIRKDDGVVSPVGGVWIMNRETQGEDMVRTELFGRIAEGEEDIQRGSLSDAGSALASLREEFLETEEYNIPH